MTRVVNGKVEVYFHQKNSARRGHVELCFSLEHFLLLARESSNLETLRCKLIGEAARPGKPKAMRAAGGA